MHGIRGDIIAGVLFFLPSFLLLSLLAGPYLAYGELPLVQGIFYGIKPAVVAIVLFAAWRIGSRALKNEVLWTMAALAFIGIFVFNIAFPWIDVYQGGVEHYQWLTGPQMLDGLALGEATPGPLIMIVTWVGYLGGVAKGVFDNPVAAGLAGAAVATFFTFLPPFLFILVGGPLVEATRGEIRFTAPLTGITAAVVGVILNLAVFFAGHTFWPQGTADAPFAGTFEWSRSSSPSPPSLRCGNSRPTS
jgi:chromate transporter